MLPDELSFATGPVEKSAYDRSSIVILFWRVNPVLVPDIDLVARPWFLEHLNGVFWYEMNPHEMVKRLTASPLVPLVLPVWLNLAHQSAKSGLGQAIAHRGWFKSMLAKQGAE